MISSIGGESVGHNQDNNKQYEMTCWPLVGSDNAYAKQTNSIECTNKKIYIANPFPIDATCQPLGNVTTTAAR
jgi:hypothetical protein